MKKNKKQSVGQGTNVKKTDKYNGYESQEAYEKAMKLYEFCFNYGYDCLMAYYECADEIEDTNLLLPMFDISGYDEFWERFGDDAHEDCKAMRDGMAAALNVITGKEWKVYGDGYRIIGVAEDSKETPEEIFENHRNIMAKNLGRILSSAIQQIL